MSPQSPEKRPTPLVVAAVVRRGEEVLLLQEKGPGDVAPSWSIPGGVVENGELLTEALVREVREETGLEVVTIGHLAYAGQIDDTTNGDWGTWFVFEVGEWAGEIAVADPDGIVLEARFMPVADALGRLASHPIRTMREPLVAYLRGESGAGTIWFYRQSEHGDTDLIATTPGVPRG